MKEYKIIDDELFNKAMSLRKRSRKEREPMPKDRKDATIEKIFDEYLDMLSEEEKQEFWIL